MDDFLKKYKQAPGTIKEFLLEEDFFAFIDEIVKKFGLDEESELKFAYLCQDMAVKAFEPKTIEEIANEIKTRLGFDQEKALQLGHFIFTRFLPLVEDVWKKPAEETRSESAQELQRLLTEIEAAKRSETPQPGSPILNLQKVAVPENLEPKPSQVVKITLPEETTPQPLPKIPPIQPPIKPAVSNLGEGVKIPAEPKTLTLKDVKEINWSNQAPTPPPTQETAEEEIPAKIIITPEEQPPPSEPLDLSKL
jgi:hypothetical protein